MDICQTGEVKTISAFAQAQEARRLKCEEDIKAASVKSRQNIEACINAVLEALRGRIIAEIALDEQRSKHNPIQSTNTMGMKRKEPNNAFEKLKFPSGMTYGHRSSLRKECSRFLRFAYLVDFISLEALANIYKNSVEELIARLQSLDIHADGRLDEIMEMDFDDASGNGQAQRGYEPLFHLSVTLDDSKQIPIEEIGRVPIDDFILPPRGKSQEKDFDLLSHLELEPEKNEEEEEGDAEEEGAPIEAVQLYRKTLPDVHTFWIKLEPDQNDFKTQITNDFQKGLDRIKVFTRWSQHGDLKKYADALEEWDDVVGDGWQEPDEKQLALDPLSWIADQEFYQTKDKRVEDIIDSAYAKAKKFLWRFQPILEIYWRNKQFDINILVNERLKNPIESLQNVMKLFKHYIVEFQTRLPSCTDIGLLQLDSKEIKKKLQPTPKAFNDQIEKLVPDVTKQRTDKNKQWLQESIAILREPVENVEEFVVQQGHLTVIDNRFQFVRDKVDLLGQFYAVLSDLSLNKPKKEDLANHTEAITQITALNQLVSNLQQAQESQSEKFKKSLNEKIPELNNAIDSLIQESIDDRFFDAENMAPDRLPKILEQLEAKKQTFHTFEQTSEKYNDWQIKLYVPQTDFANLDECRNQLINRHLMWNSLSEWQTMQAKWMDTNFG